ncbi:hypothetical protein HAX54_010175, partial [Datura stramonium]|nr:hypothetical protein [Datura stramonium]
FQKQVRSNSPFCSSAGSEKTKKMSRSSVIEHLPKLLMMKRNPKWRWNQRFRFPLVEENSIDGGDFPFAISDGLWELEDETANYYSLLQSELFM